MAFPRISQTYFLESIQFHRKLCWILNEQSCRKAYELKQYLWVNWFERSSNENTNFNLWPIDSAYDRFVYTTWCFHFKECFVHKYSLFGSVINFAEIGKKTQKSNSLKFKNRNQNVAFFYCNFKPISMNENNFECLSCYK